MGFTMMPAMSAAYVTLRPEQIARATSVANVVQRVASGFGVAVMVTILANRITANLPPLRRGVSAGPGAGIGGAHLPRALKSLLLAQVAKGHQDTFWVTVGFLPPGLPAGAHAASGLAPRCGQGLCHEPAH